MKLPSEEFNVALVGAGPIGIELAAALIQANIAYVHFESGVLGATIAWYAPGTHFFSSPERLAIAGVPFTTLNQTKATKEEYLQYLRNVAEQHALKIETYSRVSSITKNSVDQSFDLKVIQKRSLANQINDSLADQGYHFSVSAKKVILAIGDLHHPNTLNIPGENFPHVSHYFSDPHGLFRRAVTIVGSKNSAVEAALRLYRVGARVTMLVRGAKLDKKRIKYWLYPELLGLISEGKISCEYNTEIKEIDTNHVRYLKSGTEKSIESDFVFLLTGYQQDKSLFEQLGIELDGAGGVPVLNGNSMETTVPGVYVVGTAIAGTQLGGVREFIETSHVHVPRIIASLTGTEYKEVVQIRDEDTRES